MCCRDLSKGGKNDLAAVSYSCVKDEGRPLGIGFQEQVSNQSELLRSKAAVVSVGSKVQGKTLSRWVSERRAKANPAMTRRYDARCRLNQERGNLLGQVRRKPDDGADGDRRRGGVRRTQAFAWNCRNQCFDVKGDCATEARKEFITNKFVTYSCVGDEGGPLGTGFQERVPNQSELLRPKAAVVSVGQKVPGMTWGR